MKKIIAYSIIALALGGGIISYLFTHKEQTTTDAMTPLDMKPSQFVELKAINESSTMKLPAEIIADKYAEINAKVLSYVKTLRVDIGSQVNKGDLLIEFEAPEITARFASLNAKVVSLEAQSKLSNSNYNRILSASNVEGAVSDFAIEEAQSKMESDKAILEATKADLAELKSMVDYLTVRAPFSGVITQRNVEIGNLAGPSSKQPLLVLQDNRNLRIQLSITEKHAPYVRLGDTLSFTVRSLGATPFLTRVTRKAGAYNTRLRSELVEADLKNANIQLVPGMVADVHLKLNRKLKTFLVPKTAVGKSEKGSYVIMVNGDQKENSYIQTGAEQGMMVHITAEINDGKKILRQINE